MSIERKALEDLLARVESGDHSMQLEMAVERVLMNVRARYGLLDVPRDYTTSVNDALTLAESLFPVSTTGCILADSVEAWRRECLFQRATMTDLARFIVAETIRFRLAEMPSGADTAS